MLVHQLIYQGRADSLFFHSPEKITYNELQMEVVRYRNYLYQAGVCPGDRVGLLIRNSPAFVYAYMAIVSLGAVVVPINYQLTAREIAYIVKNTQMRNLVVAKKIDLETSLKSCGYSSIVEQHFIAEIAVYSAPSGFAAPLMDNKMDENQPCTIIYTSGTTGNPKGAVLTHKNLVSDAIAYSTAMPVYESDNVLCILPLYHCFAWTCILLSSLLNKASVTILDTIVPKDVIEAIKRFEITVMYGVPSVFMLLLKNSEQNDLTTLRLLVSGGASLPQQIAVNFKQKFGIGITEGYGLSEASPVVAINPQYKEKYLSIGLPLPGITVKIINSKGEKLPVGIVGELVLTGPTVMAGYFKLPEQTALALRDGWLHTGDLAYQDEDGYLFIVDRLKDLIITHGENIYPRDIEEVLYGCPGICEVAVIGIPDEVRGQVAHAYIVMKDGQIMDKKKVKGYLRKKIAPYKIPRDFIQVDSLPKNQSGKIMKRLLQEQQET